MSTAFAKLIPTTAAMAAGGPMYSVNEAGNQLTIFRVDTQAAVTASVGVATGTASTTPFDPNHETSWPSPTAAPR